MPAMAVEVGPAAGVVAAALAGAQLGLDNLISFDMGGTTAKASLIADGEIAVTAEYEVGGGAGEALAARHRASGPRAGHRPRRGQRRRRQHRLGRSRRRAEGRPAERRRRCRARPPTGGAARRPTVSDADVVLGWLDREALLGGALPIDASAARASDRGARSRRRSGLSVREAAAQHRRDRQRQHGRGVAHRLGRARPRSARVRADRVRRRRAGACGVSRRRARDRRRSSCRRCPARSRRWASSPAM